MPLKDDVKEKIRQAIPSIIVFHFRSYSIVNLFWESVTLLVICSLIINNTDRLFKEF